MADIPANGSVIRYPYLWIWQRDKGETEGRKARPVLYGFGDPEGQPDELDHAGDFWHPAPV